MGRNAFSDLQIRLDPEAVLAQVDSVTFAHSGVRQCTPTMVEMTLSMVEYCIFLPSPCYCSTAHVQAVINHCTSYRVTIIIAYPRWHTSTIVVIISKVVRRGKQLSGVQP